MEGVERLFVLRVLGPEYPEVVPGQRVVGIDVECGVVCRTGLVAPAGMLQTDPALIPQLGRLGVLGDQRRVQLERSRDITPQQMHFGHGLAHQAGIFAGVERQLVLPQRLDVVALLPEREPQIVVGERSTLADPGPRHLMRLRGVQAAIAIEREIALGAGKRGVERRGFLGRGLGAFRGRPCRRRRTPGDSRRRRGRGSAPRPLPARLWPARSGRDCRATPRSRTGRPSSPGRAREPG